MFDFLTKLFSSSPSQPDKALEITEKNTLNAKSPSAFSASAKAELEQQRQTWRQKVDAAAHSEEVLLDLLCACDHADGRLYAAQYLQAYDGTHRWLTAPSGTAGNAITWTTPMTLNASGRLLLGTTTDDGVNTLQVNGSTSVSGNVGIGTDSPRISAVSCGAEFIQSLGVGE